MKKTDFQKVIQKLQLKGFTQIELSEATGLTQGTISILLSGKQSTVQYDAGAALIALLDE